MKEKTYWNIILKNKRKCFRRELKRGACKINCREVSFVQYFAKQLLTKKKKPNSFNSFPKGLYFNFVLKELLDRKKVSQLIKS